MTQAQDDFATLAAAYAAAWSSHDPRAVAAFYAEEGQIQINRGDVLKGQQAIIDMAAGFYAEFPDLVVHCDLPRRAGSHAIFVWTLEGHHAETKNYVKVGGWEEWELDAKGKVAASLGWFDAEDYQRQVEGA
ncbi:MAG: nuclear transport factor 2 family protein [Pseudomonadota bacterium]